MIRSAEAIQHGLAHLEIGEPAVYATMAGNRFSAEALASFFGALRDGHRIAFSRYETLAGVIGDEEHNELDAFGPFGQFAGRLALHESGLVTVEKELHVATPADLQEALRGSLGGAVQRLRS